ncbi:MAG: peptidoglycan DD-metalloendopeptidase family protein [Bacteroidetes bacterium]|nr:peptidoglycan DD-metalloendopeptidase family protein [Bacteroidota bacterium]MBU1483408.1 peptidoglycan DD-metalloendopeptidase family protein [Bacteroidota bacterium]MBU2267347.1 peptidoglycan DD-metalloendopeptidase family protein [Bacteroidota bacterium]MBU2377279.1 peptidoglycan DD-metalloendopeptidase family protein [Bacteroidota bacterium]
MSKRKKLIDRLNEKYKLVILNDDTFEEKASFNASLWYLIIGTTAFAIILIFLTITTIKYTPLREYLSGITDAESKKDIVDAYTKIDSLEQISKANDIYLNNIKNVINGNVDNKKLEKPEDISKASDSIKLNQKISKEEKELRNLIESEGKFDLNAENKEDKSGIASYAFFSPLRGKITDPFNSEKQHYGIDIATRRNENIKATLDGTVVFSNFTPETGYVIAIQHGNNLLSFYKHCSVLMKKVGSFVRAGEVIAVVGDTGEYSTGPHLHFELWFDGTPVNPQNYMTF